MSVSATGDPWAKAIAVAQCSRFGVGNARYRLGSKAGFVDTVGVPLYERRLLLQVGLFNEGLGRSEDNDLHARLRRQGFKLYFFPELTSTYYSRATVSALISQMFQNGWWISATIRRQRRFPFGIRHLIPFVFYAYMILFALMTLLRVPFAGFFFCIVGTLYVACSIGAAMGGDRAIRWWRTVFVFWCMHVCYAGGTAVGFLAPIARTATSQMTPGTRTR